MIPLGLRLVVTGGREAVTRLIILITAVGIGVGLLLVAVSATNAVTTQNARNAWLSTSPATSPATSSAIPSGTARDPLWWRLEADHYDGQIIGRIDVAATGASSPVPPGMPRVPAAGQYYASPAMERLLASTPAGQLAVRYPGHLAGTIGDAALPSPDSLIIVVGHTPADMAHLPRATEVTAISTTSPSSCDGPQCDISAGIKASGMDLILSVVALAILFPVLIFIATATRLSAARREQRFAAMRLAGATPRQISLIAAVESTVAAVAGTALGFALFFALRIPLANVPFTGSRFFLSDLALSTPQVLAVAIGVPVAAAIAARLALRKVHISPLGVTRKVTPKRLRAWRTIPLLAGLAELGFFVVHGRPSSTQGQIQAFLPGFALILFGLVLAGPWLTMSGARLMASRTGRPGALIAARRLADDPRGAFRAVSGLVLALFVTTVAVALITTINANRGGGADVATRNVVSEQFTDDPRSAGGAAPRPDLVSQLHGISGVQGVVTVHKAVGQAFLTDRQLGQDQGWGRTPAGVVSCAELASVPRLGRCPAGAAAALFPMNGLDFLSTSRITWPAAVAGGLASAPAYQVNVVTDGSTVAIEKARTVLEAAYPQASPPMTGGEWYAKSQRRNDQYQQLADVVILVSLPIAGCTLAASIAAGLADRRRPFSMLRLAGAPLGMLQRVVGLESAVPLLVVAAVAIGVGFGASAMFATAQLRDTLAAPDLAYYLITGIGIAISLGIIAATLPLLRRLTGPDVARNE